MDENTRKGAIKAIYSKIAVMLEKLQGYEHFASRGDLEAKMHKKSFIHDINRLIAELKEFGEDSLARLSDSITINQIEDDLKLVGNRLK